MSYKKNIASNFATQICNMTLNFLTSIFIARALGPEGKGYIAYLLLIVQLLSNYGHLGINNATIYFQKRSIYKEEAVFSVNITYLLLISGVISAGLAGFRVFNLFLTEYNLILILFGMIFILSNYMYICVESLYIGNEKIIDINKAVLKASFLYYSCIIACYVLNLLTAEVYFMLLVACQAVKALILLAKCKIKFRPMLNIKLLLEEFKFGSIIFISSLFMYLSYRIDQILIKKIIGSSELGIYSVSVVLAELIFLIPGSINSALYARLYNIDKNSDGEIYVMKYTVKFVFYVCLLLSSVGVLMTPLIPVVYGSEFKGAVLPASILFAGSIFASIGKLGSSYFFSKGQPKKDLIITSVTLAANIIINIILIPIAGIKGAAIASCISYIIYGSLFSAYLIKAERLKFKELFMITKNDISLVKDSLRHR